LARIKAVDPDFSKDGFLAGAKAAFEMIVSAYAAGDVGTLRPLLSNEVFERFIHPASVRGEAETPARRF